MNTTNPLTKWIQKQHLYKRIDKQRKEKGGVEGLCQKVSTAFDKKVAAFDQKVVKKTFDKKVCTACQHNWPKMGPCMFLMYRILSNSLVKM